MTTKEHFGVLLTRFNTYINNINSLNLSASGINRFFELGLDLSNDTYTVEGFIIRSSGLDTSLLGKRGNSTFTMSFDTTCDISRTLGLLGKRSPDSLLLNMLDDMIEDENTGSGL